MLGDIASRIRARPVTTLLNLKQNCMKQITFDDRMLKLVTGGSLALSRDQFKIFDEPWPPKKDWKKRIIGAQITEQHLNMLIVANCEKEQRNAAGSGKARKKIKKEQDKNKNKCYEKLPKIAKNTDSTEKTKTPKRFDKNDVESRIYLDVPYAEKDEAKSYGARWDFNLKRWYVTDIDDITGLQKWFSNDQPVKYHVAKKKPVFIDDVVQRKIANSLNKSNSNGISEMYVIDCGCLPWDICTHGNARK